MISIKLSLDLADFVVYALVIWLNLDLDQHALHNIKELRFFLELILALQDEIKESRDELRRDLSS